MNILVLHPGALGDLILSLPALDLLRGSGTCRRLTIAGNTDFLEAMAWDRADRLASLVSFPLHSLFAGEGPSAEEIRFWRSYDRIVSWTGGGDPEFRRRFMSLHPEVRVVAWRPAPGDSRHVSRVFIESLQTWIRVDQDVPSPRVNVQPRCMQAATDWMRGQGYLPYPAPVALHPGAGSAGKRWPLERYLELGRRLLRSGATPALLIEGPAEEGIVRRLASGLAEGNPIVASNLPLGVLAALLSLCRGYAGNDSGISHLAAALGVPCVVLFGPTDPAQWAPPCPKVAVLRNVGRCAACRGDSAGCHVCLEALSTEEAWAAGLRIGAW